MQNINLYVKIVERQTDFQLNLKYDTHNKELNFKLSVGNKSHDRRKYSA